MTTESNKTSKTLKQWVSNVIAFSSEYNTVMHFLTILLNL